MFEAARSSLASRDCELVEVVEEDEEEEEEEEEEFLSRS